MLALIQQFFSAVSSAISQFFSGIFGGGPTMPPGGTVNRTGVSPRALDGHLSDVRGRLDELWAQEAAPPASEPPQARAERHAEITELTEEQAATTEQTSQGTAAPRVVTGLVSEPNGQEKRGPWPIYTYDGRYVGEGMEQRRGVDLAFVAANSSSQGNYDAPRLLTENHREFQIIAKIVLAEGTSNEVDEYLWIAHTANNAARSRSKTLFQQLNSSYSSVPKANKTPLPKTEGRTNANSARAGVIDVFIGNPDPTGGARFWDGTDLLAWGLNSHNGTPHNKFEEYSSMTIPQPVFDRYLAAQQRKYPGGRVRYYGKYYSIPSTVFDRSASPGNFGGVPGGGAGFHYITGYRSGHPGIVATGAHGESIFWATR